MKRLIKIGETILIGAIAACFIALLVYVITNTEFIRYAIAGIIGLGILYAIGLLARDGCTELIKYMRRRRR